MPSNPIMETKQLETDLPLGRAAFFQRQPVPIARNPAPNELVDVGVRFRDLRPRFPSILTKAV